MDFKYYEIEFSDGRKAYLKDTSFARAEITIDLFEYDCYLTGEVVDAEVAFASERDIY